MALGAKGSGNFGLAFGDPVLALPLPPPPAAGAGAGFAFQSGVHGEKKNDDFHSMHSISQQLDLSQNAEC